MIELRAVDKSFRTSSGTVSVLRGLDLTVAGGEMVAVGGPSGSGKTTLLTLIAGFEQPDAGTVVVAGRSEGDTRMSWREVAVLPQSLGLLDELTVLENVDLPIRLGGATAPHDPEELLDRLGLDHLVDRYPDEISLGEQQRVALARAAVLGPAVLLADEPISHQNEGWATTVLHVLALLADSGTACLLATHNELALDAAHRSLELRAGRLQPL